MDPQYYRYYVYGTLVTIGVTLFVSLLNLMQGIRNNRKTNFINTVTSARIEWIQKLRELISEFVTLTSIHGTKEYKEINDERSDFLDKILESKFKIILHLNYIGDPDKDIIGLVEKIRDKVFELYDFKDVGLEPAEKRALNPDDDNETERQIRSTIKDQIAELHEQLVRKVQAYLKDEWDRVKNESEFGNLKRINDLKFYQIIRIRDLSRWKALRNMMNEITVIPRLHICLVTITLIVIIIIVIRK